MMRLNTMKEALEICQRYDIIFSDVWGVIHDGLNTFKDGLYLLNALKKEGKKIVLISNSPLPREGLEHKLNNLGFGPDYYDLAYTSGDMLVHDIKSGVYEDSTFLKPFCLIGIEKDFYVPHLKTLHTPDYQNSQTAFVLSLNHWNSKDIVDFSQYALNKNITVVCGNGDIYVFKQGKKELRPGFLGKLYQSLGIKTLIYGKPALRIFEKCHELINFYPKNKIIMLGDMYETDILGALEFGIDCLHVGPTVKDTYQPTHNNIFSLKDYQ